MLTSTPAHRVDPRRLPGAVNEATISRIKALRAGVIDPKASRAASSKPPATDCSPSFVSIIDTLHCAAEMQSAMAESNAELPPDRRIEFRIGIHQGDIIVEDGDIFGDGDNVAAGLERFGRVGRHLYFGREDAAGRLDSPSEDMGEHALKNIARPSGYLVSNREVASSSPRKQRGGERVWHPGEAHTCAARPAACPAREKAPPVCQTRTLRSLDR
jgi:adenylate cyclase